MIFMFITGIVLAFLLGATVGLLYAKHERSIFTKKFTANLNKIVREYDDKLLELQKKDAETVRQMQETIKTSLNKTLLASAPVPKPEEYN